jgi:hypothetical protein
MLGPADLHYERFYSKARRVRFKLMADLHFTTVLKRLNKLGVRNTRVPFGFKVSRDTPVRWGPHYDLDYIEWCKQSCAYTRGRHFHYASELSQ